MTEVKFEPLYGLSFEQMRKVMEHMELCYRKEDVLNALCSKKYFIALSDEEQDDVLTKIARACNDLLVDYSDMPWYEALDACILEWEAAQGYTPEECEEVKGEEQ